MKKKFLFGLSGAAILSLLSVFVVLAFAMGNADGVWEYVEDDTTIYNAYCTTYGTGPGTSETDRSRNVPSIQGALGGTDENQVHYGKGTDYYSDSCPTSAPTSGWFDEQSGLGFDGNNAIGANLLEGTAFWIGRLTHYNRPVYLNDDNSAPTAGSWQFMEWVDIDVQVAGILCGNGKPPNEGSTLTFTYRVNFDETPNSASPCPYGGNTDGCYDAVSIGSAPPAVAFTCDDADEPVEGIYTITLLGFQPHNSSTCSTQTYNSGSIATQFITAESSTNHACLWAQISDFVPTAVTLQGFEALAGSEGVVLNWETISEVDTLAFNLYRAVTEDGERVLVNDELIPSNLAPGSLDGAVYSFVDPAGFAGAYYWLEEVEIDGGTSLYGPAVAAE